jgi:hypothetical protein
MGTSRKSILSVSILKRFFPPSPTLAFSPLHPEILGPASHESPFAIRIRGPLPGAIFRLDENLRGFDLNKSPINRQFLSL